MRKHFLSGAIFGTLVFVLCQYFISSWWAPTLINWSSGYPAPHKWGAALGVLGNALFSIAAVLPGLCGGFIAGRRGLLVGAVIGVLGCFLWGALLAALQFHSGALKFNAHTWAAVFIFPTVEGIGSVITCAVCGAAGELLRSRFLRSSLRPSPDPGPERR
jgi:MFS family permease